MKIFEIDFSRLIALLLPTFLRQYRLTLFLFSAVFPFIQLYDKFKLNRADNIYKINHNGQICYLRAALNDAFDISARRITIEDVNSRSWLMIYKEVEDKPVILETVKIWRENMIGSDTADFIVNVPFTLTNDELIRMKAILNYYKLISKRYIIQTQ